MKLHVSGEDYLEAILVLQKKSGMVRSIDLARHMGFSKPSISHAVGVLKKEGLRNKRSSRGEQNRKKKQEINEIALTTQLFSSTSSQGFSPISSQVTPYGAPQEV